MAISTITLPSTPDATITQTTITDTGGNVLSISVTCVPTAGTPAANAATLQQRAQTALTNNQTFLAIVSPTQAQAVTQVQALTRQVDALIRLTQSQLTSIADA